MAFRIVLEKENFKFSCSHFTILSSTLAERLHGHNYYVRLELSLTALDPDLGLAFDFNRVKPVVRAVLDDLDERVLLAEKSPYLKIAELKRESAIEASLVLGEKIKRYVFPKEDVKLLAVANISSEELARWITERLSEHFRRDQELSSHIESLTVFVEETRGQSVAYTQAMTLP